MEQRFDWSLLEGTRLLNDNHELIWLTLLTFWLFILFCFPVLYWLGFVCNERTWWCLFQKRVVCTNWDIYLFISTFRVAQSLVFCVAQSLVFCVAQSLVFCVAQSLVFCVAQSLVFCVVFCRSCFVPLSFFVLIIVLSVLLLATGWCFFSGTPVSSTNKTDRHDITEILLKDNVNNHKPNQAIDLRVLITPLVSLQTLLLLIQIQWLFSTSTNIIWLTTLFSGLFVSELLIDC